MRAVIESGLLRGKASRLYFGARTEAHLAYADRFPSWRREGVEVIPVLSRAGASWKGRRGYVQSALFEDEEFDLCPTAMQSTHQPCRWLVVAVILSSLFAYPCVAGKHASGRAGSTNVATSRRIVLSSDALMTMTQDPHVSPIGLKHQALFVQDHEGESEGWASLHEHMLSIGQRVRRGVTAARFELELVFLVVGAIFVTAWASSRMRRSDTKMSLMKGSATRSALDLEHGADALSSASCSGTSDAQELAALRQSLIMARTTAHASDLCELEQVLQSNIVGARLQHDAASGAGGLDDATVARHLAAVGANKMTPPEATSPWLLLLWQVFGGLFNVMLWICVICELALAFVLGGEDIITPIVLSGVIVASGVLQWWTEQQAEGMMTALQSMQADEQIRVRRRSDDICVEKLVDTCDLVPGDVLVLEAGEKVPADVRVLECSDPTLVDNSALTGESVAEPRSTEKSPEELALAEARNLAFCGTSIVQGRMLCVVVGTGDHTFLGEIASKIRSSRTRSSLEIQIEHFVHLIAFVAVAVGVLSLVANFMSPTHRSVAEILENAATAFFAQVPEGLLPTVTVCLMISSKKMAAKHVLVRKIDAVETLGCVNVLCSDKTGTLTTGSMTATDLVVAVGMRAHDASGSGVDLLRMNLTAAQRAAKSPCPEAAALAHLGRCAMLNTTAFGGATSGSPTEAAIFSGCSTFLTSSPAEVRDAWPTAYEIPFNSASKWMLTVHKSDNRNAPYLAVLKGAPERVLELCCDSKSGIRREAVEARLEALMSEGKRVLCFADREFASNECPPGFEFRGSLPSDVNFPLTGFSFRGLIALEDPPKPGVTIAVERIARAGARTVMVTGDHPITAEAIAHRIGLFPKEEGTPTEEERQFRVVTGAAMERWMPEDDAKLCDASPEQEAFWRGCVQHTRVFARVSPLHKRMIVRALQHYGEYITAFTGDGVNDAPALKEAEVGVAMGVRGTSVAKESADIILLDDDLQSIVAGIEQGRLCSENLRKSIMYTLCSKLPQVLPTFAELLGVPLALSAAQVLLIDIGTDIWTAIAFAWQAPESDLMERLPRHPRRDQMVNGEVLAYSYGYIGVLQSLACWVVFIFCAPGILDLISSGTTRRSSFGAAEHATVDVGMTLYYWTLVLGQVGAALAATTTRSSAFTGASGSPNAWLAGCVVFELLLALACIFCAPLAHLVRMRPPSCAQLACGLLGFAAITIFEEARKARLRYRASKSSSLAA
eukprot:TRINITY_DN3948_c2_g1_i4.p1 TRINITY_DN3948_c2_g1~~TRINITY_DN3948_c2_g1_i4.p1  ORF type:complete len:1236 (-),score=224.65 TRINITY_DN3948_c2_g1_i4:82-3789(-)